MEDVLERIFAGSIEPRDVKLSALESITKNFSEERIIGAGGFGTVYKGVLQNGEVAVKRLKNNQTIDEKLFRREVNSLLNVNHKNIVRFLGFCSNTEHKAIKCDGSKEYIYAEDRERILCFEYINHGSLDKYVADELRGLPWDTRYFIIKGICEGLQYLHMKKHIIHMDLKPANILIDYNMVAKITDFGLSRMMENSQTKSTTRFLSLGYTAPEYLDNGKMSVMSDVYSLGVIIIELVTGFRSVPDINYVLRRWRHRCHKSGKETPFRYQQITKLIEIGLLCQEKDPYKRPFISDIVREINELENMDRQISTANESTVGHRSPYLDDDMLGIEPLELRFPFEINNHISCLLKLTNETNDFIAFAIQTTSTLPYCIQPKKDTVSPRSKYSVNITLQPLQKAPQDWQYIGDFIVRSTKVNDNLLSENITEDIFHKEEGKLVDEVNLTVTYKADVPKVDVSLGSLIISDSISLHSPQESTVPPTEAESEICASTSDEVIRFDPPELCFPMVPDKTVLSSFKVINTTESFVSFAICYLTGEKPAGLYHFNKTKSVLPPRSAECLTVRRYDKEGAVENMEFNDEFTVGYAIVAEDIKACDLDANDYTQWKKLHIVVKKTSSSSSDELIQLDPPELHLPFLPNKKVLSSVKIENLTDYNVGFNTYSRPTNAAWYHTEPPRGILPPRSTRKLMITREEKEDALEDKHFNEKYFVWKSIVSEGVKDSDLSDYMADQESLELPIILDKISSSISGELIQFDPAEISIPLLLNKTMFFSVNVINITDFYVAFNAYWMRTIAPQYKRSKVEGILPPQSSKKVTLEWLTEENELEDMEAIGGYFVWNRVVTDRVESGDIISYMDEEESKKVPLVPEKASPCTADELIIFDPPQLSLPFVPNKLLVFSVNLINNTDYCVAFGMYHPESNVGWYYTEPQNGVVPPRSTQRLVVKRVPGIEEQLDMQCEDKFCLLSSLVNEGVQASDIDNFYEEIKELPIIYKKTSLCTSDELIQFDPPQLPFPFVSNKRVSMLHLSKGMLKITNVTDHIIGFSIWSHEDNYARYKMEPGEGILPPQSTQTIEVRRILNGNQTEDLQCKDKIFVWNGIVTEAVEVSDVGIYWKDNDKELSIVLTMPGESS